MSRTRSKAVRTGEQTEIAGRSYERKGSHLEITAKTGVKITPVFAVFYVLLSHFFETKLKVTSCMKDPSFQRMGWNISLANEALGEQAEYGGKHLVCGIQYDCDQAAVRSLGSGNFQFLCVTTNSDTLRAARQKTAEVGDGMIRGLRKYASRPDIADERSAAIISNMIRPALCVQHEVPIQKAAHACIQIPDDIVGIKFSEYPRSIFNTAFLAGSLCFCAHNGFFSGKFHAAFCKHQFLPGKKFPA